MKNVALSLMFYFLKEQTGFRRIISWIDDVVSLRILREKTGFLFGDAPCLH